MSLMTFAECVCAIIDEIFPRRKWTSSRRQGFFEGSHGSQRAQVADIRLNCSLTQTGSWHIPRCGQSVSPEFHVLTNVNIFLIDGSQIRLKMTARTCNIEQTSGHVRHNFVAGIMYKKGVDLDGALDWLAEYHRQILSNFKVQSRIACFLWSRSRCRGQRLCEEISPLE
jgi:hypothetical protein